MRFKTFYGTHTIKTAEIKKPRLLAATKVQCILRSFPLPSGVMCHIVFVRRSSVLTRRDLNIVRFDPCRGVVGKERLRSAALRRGVGGGPGGGLREKRASRLAKMDMRAF